MSLGWNPMEHCDGSGRTMHVDECPCAECSTTPPVNWRESDAIKQARTWLAQIDDPFWPGYTESEWATLLRDVLAERDFIGEWLQRYLDTAVPPTKETRAAVDAGLLPDLELKQ